MQNRLIANNKDYKRMRVEGDVASLLKTIRVITSQFETNILLYDAVDEVKRKYYRLVQGESDTNATFLKDYKAAIETVEHYGADIYKDTGLINQVIKQ